MAVPYLLGGKVEQYAAYAGATLMPDLPGREDLYHFIKQRPDGIALEALAQQYEISPHNSGILILLAQFLTDGLIREETRGEKLYLVAQDPDTTRETHA